MRTRRWIALFRIVTQTAVKLPPGSRRLPGRVIVLVLPWAAFNHRRGA